LITGAAASGRWGQYELLCSLYVTSSPAGLCPPQGGKYHYTGRVNVKKGCRIVKNTASFIVQTMRSQDVHAIPDHCFSQT
jgi:hypothetical protein